ncbi:MAG TPA: hypothetical protein VIN11_02225, partial [Roseivirga sp.]
MGVIRHLINRLSYMFYRCGCTILLGLLSFFTLSAQVESHIKIDSLNSTYDEHSPIVSPDGQKIYLVRSGHPMNVGGAIDPGDIWYAEKTENGWSEPAHAGNLINHSGLNGVVGFSADGLRMYLLNYVDEQGDGIGNLRNGIAVTNWVNGAWSKPERLRIQYFSNNSPHLSATINQEETVLILAMRSYLTEGNEDLYVSFKQADGQWSQPESLGSTVNTYGEEWSPYLASDNETLYFTSNAHEGFGGRDIFVTKRLDGSWKNWSKPVNLGEAFNTKGTERGYFIPKTGEMAYFSSTQNSEGFGDIFNFPLSQAQLVAQSTNEVLDAPILEETPIVAKPAQVVMTFQVLDKRTNQPIEALVLFNDADKKISVNTEELEALNRQFILSFEEGANVSVVIEAEGYLKHEENFVVDGSQGFLENGDGSRVEAFYLTSEDVGTKVKIENVLFNLASASFANPAEATKQLDEIVSLMNANPGMAIRLEGHT